MTISEWIARLRARPCAVVGLGVSNLPLIDFLLAHGVRVCARDRKSREALGETPARLEAAGVALRLGVDRYYSYFKQFGLLEKTGVDLPGEAGTIMHQPENMGDVELATVSFGQSFQITPLQLITTAASLVNGGTRVTPHLAVEIRGSSGEITKTFTYETEASIISEETSETLRYILEQVVAEGTGKQAYLEGYSIGGKTATSEKLPRRSGKYISSFLGFAPAEDPQVIGLITIDEPEGVYYGGTVAAPVMADIFANILPYLGIQPQ